MALFGIQKNWTKLKNVAGTIINPATSDKQLADNHNVVVTSSALPTGAATSAKQLPDDHNVTVSNMIPAVETGLATSANQDSVITLLTTPIDIEGGGSVSVGVTAVALTFTGTTSSIIISASLDNTGIIYIGKSNVGADGSNAVAFLYKGDSLVLDYNDASNAIYAISDTAAQAVFKGATL